MNGKESPMKGVLYFFWDIAKILIISLLIIVPIRYFVLQPFFVRGASMEPAYSQGDYLLAEEVSYRFNDPERGEVVIFQFPGNTDQFFIKRIIGLPGETVATENGEIIIINDETPDGFALEEEYIDEENNTSDIDANIELGPDEYYVLGDNRDSSYDSRRWGGLEERFIVGRVFFRAWPPGDFGVIRAPQYPMPILGEF